MTVKKSPVATFLHSLSSLVTGTGSGCEILGTLQAGVYRLPDLAQGCPWDREDRTQEQDSCLGECWVESASRRRQSSVSHRKDMDWRELGKDR